MPLSNDARALLVKLGPENVRSRLAYAGAGSGSVVPGLGDGMILREDVEIWLAERDRESDKLQSDTLFWAKAAAWIGGVGIAVAIILAAFAH